jgi:antitoxin (DNA-binding transcriptional repressor) of toxin-antitoxin stability system
MQTIQASEFKAKCLALMDKIAASGETLVVTKKGKPIVEMKPYSGKRVNSSFGLHTDLEIYGDLLVPLDQEDHSLAH